MAIIFYSRNHRFIEYSISSTQGTNENSPKKEKKPPKIQNGGGLHGRLVDRYLKMVKNKNENKTHHTAFKTVPWLLSCRRLNDGRFMFDAIYENDSIILFNKIVSTCGLNNHRFVQEEVDTHALCPPPKWYYKAVFTQLKKLDYLFHKRTEKSAFLPPRPRIY